jgi:hypothetical protein
MLIFRVAGDSGVWESKPSPFENREEAGTRKIEFKGWPTRLAQLPIFSRFSEKWKTHTFKLFTQAGRRHPTYLPGKSSTDFSLWGSMGAWRISVQIEIVEFHGTRTLSKPTIVALAFSLGLLMKTHRLKSVLLDPWLEQATQESRRCGTARMGARAAS